MKNKEELKLKHPAMFPTELISRLIKIYTKNNGEVILDPFMGTGSTVISALKLHRKGIGIELSKEYVRLAKERIKSLQSDLDTTGKKYYKPEVYNRDANQMQDFLRPNSVDLCVTSPPYWDILRQRRTSDKRDIRSYSNAKRDLGNIEGYDMFLSKLKEIFQKVYTSLKDNKWCIVIVMDIRKKSKFYPFHMDVVKLMGDIGFNFEDTIIWNRQHEYNNMRPLGYPYVFRVNKVHEYILIFRKVVK